MKGKLLKFICGVAIRCFLLSPPLFVSTQSLTAGEPLVLIGSIPLKNVEGRLDHLTFDSRSQHLFIAGLENHTVEVVDLKHRRRIHQITGVREPQGLLYVAESNRLLVCSRGDGTCRSFDATTFQEGHWIDLGRNADNIRFDKVGKTIYIGSAGEPGNGLLSAVSLDSLLPASQGGKPAEPHSPADFLLDHPREAEPAMEIPLAAHPESFQLDAANHRMYVNVPDEHEIAVIQIGSNSLTRIGQWPVTIAEKNFAMALGATSQTLYIACRKSPFVAAYSTGTGNLISKAECVGDADDLFFDEKSKRIYVIGGEGFVDVFQVSGTSSHFTRLAHLPTRPRARTGLFIPELGILTVGIPHIAGHAAEILILGAGQ